MKHRVFLLLSIIILLCLTSCGDKIEREAKTAQEFKSSAEMTGFLVLDTTSQFKGIKEAEIATFKSIQVEYFSFEVEKDAKECFKELKNLSTSNADESASAMVEEGKNFEVYKLITDKDYYIVSRTSNTVIYAGIKLEDLEITEILLDVLGY